MAEWQLDDPNVLGLIISVIALGISIAIFFFQRKIDNDVHDYIIEQKKIQESIRNSSLEATAQFLHDIENNIHNSSNNADNMSRDNDDYLENLQTEPGESPITNYAASIRQQLTLLSPYINAEFRQKIETISKLAEEITRPFDLIAKEYDEVTGEEEPPPDSHIILDVWDSASKPTENGGLIHAHTTF
jgi:hypothetical protein